MASNQSYKILVVEDDAPQRELIQDILQNAGFSVSSVESCEEAILTLKKRDFDVVFSDWKLPQLSGLDLLNTIRQQFPVLGFVMATAHGTISHAVEAMHSGADDYLAKPFQRQELLLSIDKAYRAFQLRKQNAQLSNALSKQSKLQDFVGNSDLMRQVQERLSRVADTDVSILITGESGTGKELAAQAVHRLSSRADARFVAINCGAIPADLAEAELFGAKKGAYTGATQDKLGKLEFAHNGTLFLDEIGELPLLLQAKLLRFLQEGTITPVGDTEERQLDVRIVAATHRNLPEMVEEGTFREDLFYRLNIVPVVIPPLRERQSDIPLLVEFFTQQHAKRYGLESPALSAQAREEIKNYSWPGNVRELSNRLERFVLLGDENELIPSPNDTANSGMWGADSSAQNGFVLPQQCIDFEEHERSLLEQALSYTDGNRTNAAKLLNLNYKQFLYRLDKHQLNAK